MDVLAFPKSHPWMTGAIIVGGGLVFMAIASGGGGGGAATSSGPSDAEIAAQAQIAAAQITAQAQQAQAGAALQAAQIGAGVQMNSDRLSSEIAMRELEVNQALGLSGIEAQRQLGLAQTDAQKSVSIADIQSRVQTQQIIANASTSQAKSANKSSTIGSILGFAGTALAIFSDDRLKENIVRVGTHPNGYGIYEYNYKGDTTRRQGVIAKDVEQYRPDLVITDKSGYLKFKPQALALAA